MANSVFQNVIIQLREVSDRVFGVIDTDGCVVSCTDPSLLGERWTDAALKVANSSESVVTFGQKCFKAITSNTNNFEYAVFCSGIDKDARSACIMAHIALNDAKTFYEEKHDRGTFVKNIIMDNILPGDIYIRAKELHFATDAPRAVFLVRQLGRADVATVDVLSGMFPDKSQDFVLSINETDIAVVKQIAPGTTGSFALAVENTSEVNAKCSVALKVTNEKNIPLQYSVDGRTWVGSIDELALTEKAVAMNAEETFTVYWRWAFEGNNVTEADAADTKLGIDGDATVTITATLTATQVD